MLKKIFFCFCFLFALPVFAQDPVLLKGKIVADSLIEASVHIVNLNRKTGTINTEEGNFQIKVRENDSLFFSSMQYEVKELVVSARDIDRTYIEVELVSKINELEEVKISDVDLSGNLERDIADIKITNPNNFGIPWPSGPPPSVATRRLYTASTGPLDVLLNSLSGKLEKAKKFKANEDLSLLVERGINVLLEDFFIEELGLAEKEIENFVYYCAETDPEFKKIIAANQQLDLIEYYQSKLPEFLEIRERETNN